MTLTESKTNYYGSLVTLYHLLITADGHVDEKEVQMGELMKQHENINDSDFNFYLEKVADMKKEDIIAECVAYLKQCEVDWRIKCIAWMSLIANSDGFMAPEEWKLIYYIYNTQLKLSLSDILAMQKSLPRPSAH